MSPAVLGVVVLGASAVGALNHTPGAAPRFAMADANGLHDTGTPAAPAAPAGRADRRSVISRGSSREARQPEAGGRLVAAAEKQSRQREAVLTRYEAQAAAQAENIEQNQWTLPVSYVDLTARFGDFGLWANLHTGLDFNGDDGDPIYSVANGTVTAVGYDGSYGNKTVVTLEDGTEIWYCHQSTFLVSLGEQVRGGEQIGTIGSTGNVTGSHLHLEVRPGGGDPVDPEVVFAGKGLL